MDFHTIITVDPNVRSGKPTVRGLRITVSDVLGWLASGMSHDEIVGDFPEITQTDILACLAYAAVSQNQIVSLKAA